MGNAHVREALVPVYDSYFVVQIALARDDEVTAREGAHHLSDSVESVDTSGWADAERRQWLVLSERISRHAGELSQGGDIGETRDAFYHVSDAIIGLHEVFGHEGPDAYYVAHCPMAREGEGANWLQQEDVISNSFFGEKMLRCGSIELELIPGAGGKH
jgi:hypothetical protein